MAHEIIIKPQPGFQEKVFGCEADIAIIGGSAGGGKTMSLIVEPLKWTHAPDFAAVFFRRTMERIRATGGLLAESKKWYVEGTLTESILKWKFPSGAQIDFEGIEHEKDLEKWLGTQIPLIIFDEVTEFLEGMFWFMVSRNRGIVRWRNDEGKLMKMVPYVRASCNPKPNSWVARLISWWIDQETGYPIPERDGVLRYFVRYQDKMYWGGSKEEVIESCPHVFAKMREVDPSINPHDLIKSFTFIRGKLSDNKILTQNSPEYYSSLLSLPEEEQKRYLDGNWKIASDGLDLFNPMRILPAVENKYNKDSIFNFPELRRENMVPSRMFITCDAAKFGQDLCVIYVWNDWIVIHTTIFYLSAEKDIHDEIELQRRRFNVPRINTMVDQDGLGGDVVKLGRYLGFVARKSPQKDETTNEKENYDTFKDQCYFKFAEKVNSGECKFICMQSTVKIFDRGATKARYSTKMRYKGDLIDVREMIILHLNAIKKAETVFEGGEAKYSITSKEEQKEIIDGASPDLADCGAIRGAFDCVRRRKGTTKVH